MFEKFTERARKVMSLARQEAQRLNNDFIGPDHILLGIIAEGAGVACMVFKRLNVQTGAIKTDIEKHMVPSPLSTLGQLPFNPRAKRVIEIAGEVATQLGEDVIGTEHLLLGLIRENESVAAMVLNRAGLQYEPVKVLVGQLKAEESSIMNNKPVIKTIETTIIGTITDTRPETFTVLERDGQEVVVRMELLGADDKLRGELTKGRRIQIDVAAKYQFLD
jgi:ATP-dependent Clp protease ATP-binding subunit ClpA